MNSLFLHTLITINKRLFKLDDVLNLMFDESSGIDHRTLIGHSGPVFGVSFSPGNNLDIKELNLIIANQILIIYI